MKSQRHTNKRFTNCKHNFSTKKNIMISRFWSSTNKILKTSKNRRETFNFPSFSSKTIMKWTRKDWRRGFWRRGRSMNTVKRRLFSKFKKRWRNNSGHICRKSASIRTRLSSSKTNFPGYKTSTNWSFPLTRSKQTANKNFSSADIKFSKRNITIQFKSTTRYKTKLVRIELLSSRRYKC